MMKLTGKFYLPNPTRPYWNAHSNDVRKMLGLPDKAKLPADGMPARIVKGMLKLRDEMIVTDIKVWVTPEPLVRAFKRAAGIKYAKSSAHRVMAECPHCGWTGSAGRLPQHVCKGGK